MKRALLAVAVAALAVGYVSTRAAARAATGPVYVPACPSHAPESGSLGASSSRFVRPGARLIRLCRYSNINWGNSQGLLRHRLIRRGTTISSLTRSFNRLKEPPRGIFCVRDDGSEMLVAFGYAGAKPERVIVRLSGCRFAMNGPATRSTTAKLHDRLLALSKS
jgi:hypothetical protein